MGIVAGVVLGLFYLVAIFAGYFSPYDHNEIQIQVRYLPPQDLHFDWSEGFYVYGLTSTQNPVTLELAYETDQSRRYPVRFLSRDASGDFRLVIRKVPCTCSVRTAWAATCSRASFTAPAFRLPWGSSASSSA